MLAARKSNIRLTSGVSKFYDRKRSPDHIDRSDCRKPPNEFRRGHPGNDVIEILRNWGMTVEPGPKFVPHAATHGVNIRRSEERKKHGIERVLHWAYFLRFLRRGTNRIIIRYKQADQSTP
jgi:hypothetical protein